MRMDLSREEEINLPSESLGLVSMNAFQKEYVEKIGCTVQEMKLNDLIPHLKLYDFNADLNKYKKTLLFLINLKKKPKCTIQKYLD